jgi:phosphatidylglycerol:prolipoprotein diacylglycerol transferase
MLLYGISRFIIEFYRGDDRGVVFDVLSTSQFIAVIIVPVSLFMLYWLSRARPAEPSKAPARQAVTRASQA